jgi:hypothetical protein
MNIEELRNLFIEHNNYRIISGCEDLLVYLDNLLIDKYTKLIGESIEKAKSVDNNDSEVSYNAAIKLIEENVDIENEPIRALSITGTKLLDSFSVYNQASFFDIEEHQKHEKEERLELARDKIRKKYGLEKLTRCSLMENDFGI